MALIKKVVSREGNETNYWKISRCFINTVWGEKETQECVCSLDGYKDKEFRVDPNIPNSSINIIVPIEASTNRETLYMYLKSKDLFVGCADDFDVIG